MKRMLKFLGGVGTVTGSKFLFETEKSKVLIDCGLFQGIKQLRKLNYEKIDFDIASLDAILLTHAHLDHSGYIPKLYKDGFRGDVFCTQGTKDLCEIILPDSGYIQEEDARYADLKGFSKHKPSLSLYTQKDAVECLSLFKPVNFNEEIIYKDLSFKFSEIGHIIGAACISITHQGKRIIFSGDIGKYNDLIMHDPKEVEGSPDWLVIESTYGDRLHSNEDPIVELEESVLSTLKNNGVVLIPSFAVGRAQAVIYALYCLFEKYQLFHIPVYLNSPMATKATKIFCRHEENHKLNALECKNVFDFPHYINSVDESIELNEKNGPMVIVSASGMLTGGRVLHHLKAYGGNPKNLILMVGFQASGTRGADLIHGVKDIKIHGTYHKINAQVKSLNLFSAHADQKGLLKWLESIKRPPKKIFIVHGEPYASDQLRKKIEDKFSFDVEIPYLKQSFDLS